MTKYPQFRSREVVRVARMVGWPDGTPDLLGQEGTVSGYSPNRSGTGWYVAVWLPALEKVWSFDEESLESTGVVEEEGGPRRVPVDPSTHEKSFPAELVVRLYTKIEAKDAPEVAGSPEVALRSLISVERVTWEGEVHWDETNRYDLTLHVHVRGDSREAFEQRVASRQSGWDDRKVDDGWSCDFGWRREADESGEPFLSPEAKVVSVLLTPWSDPSSRAVKKGRTHDPGLPGFTPPPPAAGYE